MLSEDKSILPIFPSVNLDATANDTPVPRRRPAGFGSALPGFLTRLMHGGRRRVSELPDELYADVGLVSPVQERADAFWQTKRLSAARNLSL